MTDRFGIGNYDSVQHMAQDLEKLKAAPNGEIIMLVGTPLRLSGVESENRIQFKAALGRYRGFSDGFSKMTYDQHREDFNIIYDITLRPDSNVGLAIIDVYNVPSAWIKKEEYNGSLMRLEPDVRAYVGESEISQMLSANSGGRGLFDSFFEQYAERHRQRRDSWSRGSSDY